MPKDVGDTSYGVHRAQRQRLHPRKCRQRRQRRRLATSTAFGTRSCRPLGFRESAHGALAKFLGWSSSLVAPDMRSVPKNPMAKTSPQPSASCCDVSLTWQTIAPYLHDGCFPGISTSPPKKATISTLHGLHQMSHTAFISHQLSSAWSSDSLSQENLNMSPILSWLMDSYGCHVDIHWPSSYSNPQNNQITTVDFFFPIGLRYPVGVKHHLPMEPHVSDHFPMVLI